MVAELLETKKGTIMRTLPPVDSFAEYFKEVKAAQAMVSGMVLPKTVDFGSKWETAAKKCRE